jgi:phage terminase small subunit
MAYISDPNNVPKKGKGSKLTPKMERFVEEYLVDLNASAAVKRAEYKTNNAHKMGAQLLQHPLVKAKIEEKMNERRERMELTADYVITKLINIIESTETNNPQAALRGLELAGKHLGLYKDRQEISGPDGDAIRVEEKKIDEDVADFQSKLARLTKRTGTNGVTEFPKPTGSSET